MRDFELADILSVTTGRMLSRRNLNGIRDLMEYIVGEDLPASGLVCMKDFCTVKILEQYPELLHVDYNENENIDQWLEQQEKTYGYLLAISR